jgi:5'(3')-deoxyribonucleotidase
MRFLIDVDGVCADSFAELGIDPKDIPHYDFTGVPEYKYNQIIEAFNTKDYWNSLLPMLGAQEGIDALNGMGHEIVFVTSPWPHTPHNWAELRKQWLLEHFGIYPLVVTAHKEYVSGDIIIDDKAETILRCQELYLQRQRGERQPKPYLFGNYGYNQVSGIKKFYSWEQIIIYFQEQYK